MDMPENVFSVLRLAPREFANEMRINAAVQWYGEKRVYQGKAAEIAGISRIAYVDELRYRHVPALQIDTTELDAELG
jgi:predicted HTH domain antitoxin